MTKWILAALVLVILPVSWSAHAYYTNGVLHWRDARWDSAKLLPDGLPRDEAMFQIYAARAWGKKGIVAVHSWIVLKRPGEIEFERYDVVGWGVHHGRDAIRRNMRPADGHWAGNPPELVADLRGDQASHAIKHALPAIENYPHDQEYMTWPGPNSNSFVAHVLRAIPDNGISLPTTAIGKDYISGGNIVGSAPSGTGWQISVFGLASLTIARVEGLELSFMGLAFGVEPMKLAVKLPAVGRISFL